VAAAWFDEHLACPDCRRDLGGDSCACGFAPKPGPPRDFRPQNPQERVRSFALRPATDLANVTLERPRDTYGGPRAIRDSGELFSAAEAWMRRDARLLDFGCGPRDQAAPAAHYGLQYVGVDYDSKTADLLADGHALPFRAETFDAVLSYAVLEHLYNPFVALDEVARVLKPGGVFFGTVSQGEPFHDSYFHHTAWGVLSVFGSAGMRVTRLWPSYDTLHALSGMGRYPKVQRLFIESVYRAGWAMPFLAPRKWLRGTRREKELDELHRAASLCFIAVK
jgi:SAM-dependent methyltransferase